MAAASTADLRHPRWKQNFWRALKHVTLIAWCVCTVYPLVWVVISAFKDNPQIFVDPFALPNPVISENLSKVFASIDFFLSFTNTMLYSVCTVAVVLILTSMAGFYCAKLTKGMKIYGFLILGMMIPVQTLLIPIFTTYVKLGLNNTRIGLVLAYIGLNISFGTFIFTGFMRGVPDEIVESAIIDGCSSMRAFFSIVLPISKPGLATVGTFVFLNVWNDFLMVFILATNPVLRTINLACYQMRGMYSSDYGMLSAGVVILMVPAIIIFVLFQEQVIKGLTAGAVKG